MHFALEKGNLITVSCCKRAESAATACRPAQSQGAFDHTQLGELIRLGAAVNLRAIRHFNSWSGATSGRAASRLPGKDCVFVQPSSQPSVPAESQYHFNAEQVIHQPLWHTGEHWGDHATHGSHSPEHKLKEERAAGRDLRRFGFADISVHYPCCCLQTCMLFTKPFAWTQTQARKPTGSITLP